MLCIAHIKPPFYGNRISNVVKQHLVYSVNLVLPESELQSIFDALDKDKDESGKSTENPDYQLTDVMFVVFSTMAKMKVDCDSEKLARIIHNVLSIDIHGDNTLIGRIKNILLSFIVRDDRMADYPVIENALSFVEGIIEKSKNIRDIEINYAKTLCPIEHWKIMNRNGHKSN
ncbi:hypothetical protein ACOME3_005830 [Neoechinorhynchus agilis]